MKQQVIPTEKGNNQVELKKEHFSKSEWGHCRLSGSISKYVMPSTLHRVYKNCEECKLAHPKHGS